MSAFKSDRIGNEILSFKRILFHQHLDVMKTRQIDVWFEVTSSIWGISFYFVDGEESLELWKNALSCQVARPDLFAALDFHRMIKWILTCVPAMGTLWIQVGSDLPVWRLVQNQSQNNNSPITKICCLQIQNLSKLCQKLLPASNSLLWYYESSAPPAGRLD